MLLSERSLDDRRNRTRVLPVSGLTRTVAIRTKVRPNPYRGGWAFSARGKTEPAKVRSSQPLEPCIDPLYLFVCGLSWGRYSNTSAGWELIRCLQVVRADGAVAAALLAQAEQ